VNGFPVGGITLGGINQNNLLMAQFLERLKTILANDPYLKRIPHSDINYWIEVKNLLSIGGYSSDNSQQTIQTVYLNDPAKFINMISQYNQTSTEYKFVIENNQLSLYKK